MTEQDEQSSSWGSPDDRATWGAPDNRAAGEPRPEGGAYPGGGGYAPPPGGSDHVAPQSGSGAYAHGDTPAGSQPPYPGASYQAPEASSYQGPSYPRSYAGPPYQTDPQAASYPAGAVWPPTGQAGDRQPSSGRRLARGVVIGVFAIALALFSGVAGGLVVHRYDGNNRPVTPVTRNAAPVVDRGSVASVAAAVQPAVVDITTTEGEGSGVVISADGNILTNNHVLQGVQGNTVNVTFNNGKKTKATIVGTDPAGDLAVIKAQDASGLTVAKFGNSDDVQVGDTVLALGSPLGLQGSVTAGIVSALHRTIDEGPQSGNTQRSVGDAIQTDAAINPGNSGGALVNLAGEVIGINTAIATSGQGASGNIGVGFAISSNVAKSTADQLLKGGKVSHPYLGVQVTDGDGGGALIAAVVPGGPADKAGLQKGDIVTKIGSQDIPDAKALVAAVKAGKAGDQIQITIRRNGAEQKITATLGES
jgi:putative serine protease PepD